MRYLHSWNKFDHSENIKGRLAHLSTGVSYLARWQKRAPPTHCGDEISILGEKNTKKSAYTTCKSKPCVDEYFFVSSVFTILHILSLIVGYTIDSRVLTLKAQYFVSCMADSMFFCILWVSLRIASIRHSYSIHNKKRNWPRPSLGTLFFVCWNVEINLNCEIKIKIYSYCLKIHTFWSWNPFRLDRPLRALKKNKTTKLVFLLSLISTCIRVESLFLNKYFWKN